MKKIVTGKSLYRRWHRLADKSLDLYFEELKIQREIMTNHQSLALISGKLNASIKEYLEEKAS